MKNTSVKDGRLQRKSTKNLGTSHKFESYTVREILELRAEEMTSCSRIPPVHKLIDAIVHFSHTLCIVQMHTLYTVERIAKYKNKYWFSVSV